MERFARKCDYVEQGIHFREILEEINELIWKARSHLEGHKQYMKTSQVGNVMGLGQQTTKLDT